MVIMLLLAIISASIGAYLVYQNHDYESRWDYENAQKLYNIGIALIIPLPVLIIGLVIYYARKSRKKKGGSK